MTGGHRKDQGRAKSRRVANYLASGATLEAQVFLIAALCRLAKLLSYSEQMGYLVGAVGIEHDPRTTKSRGMMALRPPAKSNC